MVSEPSIIIKAKNVGIPHNNRFTQRILSVMVLNSGKNFVELVSVSIVFPNGDKHLLSSPQERFNLPRKLKPGLEISIEFDGSGENDRFIGEKNAMIVCEDNRGSIFSATIE